MTQNASPSPPMLAGRGAEMLPSSAEMREAEMSAIAAGLPASDMMERAGRALASAAAAMATTGGRILVLCGPGNNGGDGFVAARLLRDAGRTVELASAVPVSDLSGEAARAASGWAGPVGRLAEVDPGSCALVLDALFGTGLKRDLAGEVLDVVERVNASRVAVLAADIPSGIDADTGEIRGAAIRAARTIAFAARKPGHLLQPGRAQAGAVEVAEIGVTSELVRRAGTRTVANGPEVWLRQLPGPGATGHKYDRGHAVVLSGSVAHTGAARLAARGALRAGAGLVTVVTSGRALAINAAQLTAIMLRVADDPDELSDLLTDERLNALVLGPALGIGEATRNWVAAALEADRATVLDADALTSFAGRAEELRRHLGAGRATPAVLTPHDGEFKRLLAGPEEPSEEARAIAGHPSRLDRARRAAAFLDCVVVLKGPDTVVAGPDGRAAINENGSPHLATAGSGDVLCGMIAGLLAQGMDGFEAAAAAVWMHADAATRFGPGLISEDLPEMLPAVLRGLRV